MRACPSELSIDSHLHHFAGPRDFLDCYSVPINDRDVPIDEVVSYIFKALPWWINGLLRVRDAGVSVVGLKTTASLAKRGAADERPKVNFLKILSVAPDEIILGEDDRHLDFRIAVRRDGSQNHRISLATWVHTHNAFGRLYLRTILPLHIVIVKARLTALSRRYAKPARRLPAR